MRCLWLTCFDPQPEYGGQWIYSGRLIDALADAGAAVEVLCLARNGSQRRDGDIGGRVLWHIVDKGRRSAWGSILSKLPNVTYRTGPPAIQRRFATLVAKGPWDTILIDGLYVAWSLPILLLRFGAERTLPRIVYVSHNHEESLRAQVVENYRGNAVARAILVQDARKASRLERRVVDAADLVTANTPEDAARYAIRRRSRPILVLLPGYQGRQLSSRRITAELPRRAVVIGSFDWMAKRMNLQEFLHVADPMFAAAGIELQVIGDGEKTFLDQLRRKLKTTEVTGSVDSVLPYMDRARIAIVPERTGGGFKHKVLTYVFNRLPIAALDNSIAGMPLTPRESLLTYPDVHALARGVLGAIDDLELLNRVQERAFVACSGRFDWRSRGEQLFAAVAAA